MELVNDILKTEIPMFSFSNPPIDPIELAKTLTEHMLTFGGVGLSANQIGLPYRAFAIRSNPVFVMFNAKIVHESEEQILMPEGCLSFPGLVVKIKRPKTIRVRFTMPNGVTETKQFDGLTARVIQHEMDHMNGKLFYEKATLFHLEQGRRQAKRKK